MPFPLRRFFLFSVTDTIFTRLNHLNSTVTVFLEAGTSYPLRAYGFTTVFFVGIMLIIFFHAARQCSRFKYIYATSIYQTLCKFSFEMQIRSMSDVQDICIATRCETLHVMISAGLLFIASWYWKRGRVLIFPATVRSTK